MGNCIKFLKRKNLVCLTLFFIEFLAFGLSISLEFYMKYTGKNSHTIDTFAFIVWIIGWILILPIVRFTPMKKGNLKGILIILLSISIGLAAHYQKPKLLYVDVSGGSCQVFSKGHDLIGYYLNLDIIDETSDYHNQKGKFYCTKERYDELQIDEIYYTELLFNPNINWGTLRHINY